MRRKEKREKMENVRKRKQLHGLILATLLLVSLLLTSCESSAPSNSQGPHVTNGGKGCTKVGILLPEVTSARWETNDHPQLIKAVTAAIPGVHIDYNNAQASSDIQLSQAETDLANGDCILIVASHDSVAAAAIVAKAKAANVPVIAYDRLIESKALSYYVSFNNVTVGELQAQYIVAHYQAYEKPGIIPNMVVISGSKTDENALGFSEGAHTVLDPLLAQGKLNDVYENFTANWDPNAAQTEMEAVLTDQQNDIQIAYVANDDMAQTVIAALKAVGLTGKVLVTGQDATIAGVHSILLGSQSMTVYKPIAQEAASVGTLVKAIYQGTDTGSLTKDSVTTTTDGGNIPSILDTPVIVDQHNIASTIIADGFLSANAICTGIPSGTDGVC